MKVHATDLAIAVTATGQLCRCGSHTIAPDKRLRWRCTKGHFATPTKYRDEFSLTRRPPGRTP